MSQSAKKVPQICLDNRWIPCQSAGEFGFLSDRFLCDLGETAGQPAKNRKLLLFRLLNGSPSSANVALKASKFADEQAKALGLRPVAVKTYDYAAPATDGKLKRNEEQFLQQDVSGLATLRGAILKAARAGSPGQVWYLYFAACKALNQYGRSIGNPRPVPLQCPNSLAVDTGTGQVVLLDAEMKIPELAGANEAAFANWFGAAARAGHAPLSEASRLHSKGLLLFFREVLGYLGKQDAASSAVAKLVDARLAPLAAAKSLQEAQDEAEKHADLDWSIPSDDAAPAARNSASSSARRNDARPATRPAAARTWLRWFVGSFLVNVGLVVLLFLLAGLRLFSGAPLMKNDGQEPAANGGEKKDIPDDPSMQFSSYCVVFPANGTVKGDVLKSLKQMLENEILEPAPGEPAQNQLLRDRLDLAVQSLQDAGKIQELVVKLNRDHSIRFNGFSAKPDHSGLRTIVENGGPYRNAPPAKTAQHGSLLSARSVDRILAASGMDKLPEARLLLEALKAATHEYACLKDAVKIIGNRTAFLLRVEPTAKAHEAVRTLLVARAANPVFIPRPVFELFDAVDPEEIDIGGDAAYRLKMRTPCDWRLVSLKNREKTDYKMNETNKEMNWRSFAADQEIKWEPAPVLNDSGGTDLVSSFDIAITVNPKQVVVFRNQSISVGSSKDQIHKRTRDYLERRLHLKGVDSEDAVTVLPKLNGFAGALRYNYLAERAVEQAVTARDDLEIMTAEQFDSKRKEEDALLNLK